MIAALPRIGDDGRCRGCGDLVFDPARLPWALTGVLPLEYQPCACEEALATSWLSRFVRRWLGAPAAHTLH